MRKVGQFESHCHFSLLDRGVAMHIKTPSFEVEEGGGGGGEGVQAETTISFMVWWVLFEYSSFDHFP